MPSTLTCPDEAELLPLAMGDPVADEVIAHLAGCLACQSRLEILKAEVALLRAEQSEGAFSPSLDHEHTTASPGEGPAAG